jgi:outer membrane protein OmpA-like peptidoglycan-associated protein
VRSSLSSKWRPRLGICVALVACASLASLASASVARAQVEAEFKDDFDKAGAAQKQPAPAPAEPAEKPASEKREHDADTAAKATPPESRDAQLLRAQNTWLGPVGGLHVVDAGSGPGGTLRLQLGVDFFSSHGFLIQHDVNQYSGGTLAIGWTLNDYLELFGSVANHANYNDQENPRLLQVLGDTLLGIKAFHAVAPWLTLGGDFRLVVLNTVGDIGPVLSALSFGFRGNASADLRKLEQPVPLILRASIDYFFDNSANLIQKLETQRYEALGPAALPRAQEDRNLIRRVERFALGINRTDAFDIGLGAEAPLQVAQDFFIHPLLEWTLGIPVNRQGYSCLRVATNSGPAQPDGCLKLQGLAAMPSSLTLGARVFPPVRGLAFALGFDIGLTGTSDFVRELAANKPYDVLIALSYTVDARERPAATRAVEIVREVVKAPPARPRVQGSVVDSGTGGPVAGAAIHYPDRELTAQQTDEQGRFVSYELPAGEARFEISHPDYEPRVCTVQVPEPPKQPPAVPSSAPAVPPQAAPASATSAPTPAVASQTAPPVADAASPAASASASALLVPLRCELVAKPRAGSVRGLVLAEGGKPVAGAKVELTGPSSQSLVTDAQGQFVVVSAVAGSYGVRVDAEAYLIRLVSVEVKPGETATPEIVLVQKPKQAQVELTKQEVRIRKQIFFRLNSAEISEKSNGLLSEIADVLLRNPQVKQVEIQGHTDNKGAPEVNQQLSQLRAEAVRAWLVNAGVEAGRLAAKGYGDTHPLVPNLTERHRALNRRVQFMIKAQD